MSKQTIFQAWFEQCPEPMVLVVDDQVQAVNTAATAYLSPDGVGQPVSALFPAVDLSTTHRFPWPEHPNVTIQSQPLGDAGYQLTFITENGKKDAQKELVRQIQYEQGLARTAQALLAKTDQALRFGLGSLLDASQVGRVFTFDNRINDVGELCFRAGQEVCEVGVEPRFAEASWQAVPYEGAFGRWQEVLGNGRFIDTLTDEEAHAFQLPKGASVLLLPLIVNEKWVGMVGFEDTRKGRVWSVDEVNLLQTAVTMINLYLSRRDDEETLRLLNAAINASADGITIANATLPDMPLIYVNEGFTQTTGYPVQEAIGRNCRFLQGEQADQPVLAELRQALKKGQSFQGVLENYRKDGTLFWNELALYPLYNDAGKLTHYVGVQRDVTQRVELDLQEKETLNRRSKQINLSTKVTQAIIEAESQPQLYQTVVDLIQDTFNYYHVQILQYDSALDVVKLVAGSGEVGQQLLAENYAVTVGVGLVGIAAATGQAILRPHAAKDPNWQLNPRLPQTKGELVVPILLGETVLSILDIHSDQPHKLSEEDLFALESICAQLAVAIEGANLREEMQNQLSELSTLQRFMTRDGWEEYRATRQEQVNGYQFSTQGVVPVEPDFWLPVDKPQDYSANGGSIQPPTVLKPLDIRGEQIGLIGIESTEEDPLTPEELEILDAISEQVAEALEAARLLEQTQDALSTQERLSSELRTVAEVSTVTSTIMERDNLLQKVVDLTKHSFNLYHAHIYLMEMDQETLLLRAGADEIGRLMALEERRISINAESIVARCARTRQSVVENDTHQAEGFLSHPLLKNTRSELAVPMVVGDQIVGVLDVQASVINRFGEQDILIMRTLASQIAVAVQNAEQFAEQVSIADKLRDVERLKSEFLASMSHELRTPLNSIIGFADVMLEGLDGELNERMEQDVRLIRDSGNHLRNLIGDILDMSKIEAGRMDLRYEELDMRRLSTDLIAMAQGQAAGKDLSLNLNLDDNVSHVQADATRMRQILWNIVSNAIKFTEKGSVTLSLKMNEADELLIAIRDTGIGISPENIAVVFEQFRQIDGSLNRSVGGTGLGMPITKKLVELHGGKIWIESTLGEGTTFWFTIPRFPPEKRADTGVLGSY